MTFKSIFSFIRSIKNILLFLILFAFLLSILSNIISPETTRFIAPFGLLFIPLFSATVIILILNIKGNKSLAITAFLLLVFSLNYFSNSFSLTKNQEKGSLKVMTWNVKNFDLYNWTKNKETRKRMLQIIDTIDADVLCMQEFFTNKFEYNNIESLQALGYKYYSFIPSYVQSQTGNQWGLAIFSKYPISNEKLIYINPKKNSMNQCLKADIRFKGITYHIFNAHFQSIHLDYEDYDYIQDVKTEWSMLEYFKSYQIIHKVLNAYAHRTQQINELIKELPKKSDAKTILCCDMNDIPNSYAYNQISTKMNDAYRAKGGHFSNTISMFLPIYRIDYMFTSENIETKSYRRQKTKLSDHHFLVCSFD